MDFLVIIFEVVTMVSLIIFSGILDSKYYESKKIRYLNKTLWVPAVLLLIALYPEAQINNDNHINCPWLHVAFNVAQIGSLAFAYVKFSQLTFNYSRQYLFARGALRWSIVSEVLAVGTLIASFFV